MKGRKFSRQVSIDENLQIKFHLIDYFSFFGGRLYTIDNYPRTTSISMFKGCMVSLLQIKKIRLRTKGLFEHKFNLNDGYISHGNDTILWSNRPQRIAATACFLV